jgi:hypothetical protein
MAFAFVGGGNNPYHRLSTKDAGSRTLIATIWSYGPSS